MNCGGCNSLTPGSAGDLLPEVLRAALHDGVDFLDFVGGHLDHLLRVLFAGSHTSSHPAEVG